ncbi:TetR family transcriptional regulator [Mangrovactinospora gilvigrisea]|uniref:TetR family transcriptional regulator n=1 Tax=Mangrovactinospora gilvigrisea TaxID=1428644 RepID=A0A1J7BCT2_9ACTN|nr:TetR/AcrR family transcriptional regulator [Mangrovactinospora gilvigrisea]OIV36405.1 TetR family transcriptional regulator [Mangrovactinospora gilvigrisea]
MPPVTSQAPDGRRAATRQRLYEAAVTLIAEQGFSATTVDEIAERAGVAKGTVYYNFGSKNELFEQLLRHGIGLLAQSLRDARAAHPGAPLEALDAMVRAGLVFAVDYPAFMRLLCAEMWRTNRAWQETLRLLREGPDGPVAEVRAVLDEARADGLLPEEVDTGLAGPAVFGMVLVVALDWLTFQPERELDDIHAVIMTLIRART